MPKRTLLVYPNPFHAVDHEGCPAGVLPHEPEGDGVNSFDDRRFVGATLRSEVLQKFRPGDARHTIQRTWFDYSDEPVRVKDSAYYRQAIARGEIFAADQESAALCGINSTFLEPGPLLVRAREEAIGAWLNLGHEDHDDTPPEKLTKFAFGPMPEAVEARKKLAAEEKKAAEAPKAPQPEIDKSAVSARGGK